MKFKGKGIGVYVATHQLPTVLEENPSLKDDFILIVDEIDAALCTNHIKV